MLPETNAKIAPCLGGCGAQLPYKTNSKVCCPACAPDRKRARDRAAAERKRRKHGVVQVKGALAACDKCERQFVRLTRTHRFCDECSSGAALEYSRDYQRRKHRADGREQVGTRKSCANPGCETEFAKAKKGRQIYCIACMKLQKEGKLPSLRVSISKRCRRRYATEPAFALNSRMRRALGHSLGDAKAGRSWESLVGYTVAELMRHLERQFLSGMSWENRSDWQIDHRLPLAGFSFESADDPEFRAAWAISNLQPLWADDNLEKRAQRLHLI